MVFAILLGLCAESSMASTPSGPMSSLEEVAETDGEGAEKKDPSEYFMPLYLHLKQHPYSDEAPFVVINEQPPIVIEGFTNHALAIIIVGVLLIAFFFGLARSRSRNEVPRGILQNSLESLVCWVRDDVVYKTMGEMLGRRFLPLFLTQFFMILGLNLMGLLPNFDFLLHLGLPTTATANVSVTLGFSLVTFFAIHMAGVKEHGPVKYVKSWVPEGLGPINIILFPVECLGHFVKPTALTIRLFANMTGGHLAILTMCGLIFFLAKGGENWAAGFPVMIVGVAFNVFLTLLEILICFIQAFVFTYLSVIFIGAAVHPEH